jgi:RNA 2',3'-cyclic 3'-phosphodiesterase
LRLFYALWPDENVRQQFADAACRIGFASGGRLVLPRNYHLTLAFIGEVADLKLAVLQQIGATFRAPRFVVRCDALEYWSRSRVVVAAVQAAPDALLDLARQLNAALELPSAPFRAHVTLARKVTQAPVLPAMSSIDWQAAHFSLIRSQTGGVESAYTVVGTWPLLYET